MTENAQPLSRLRSATGIPSSDLQSAPEGSEIRTNESVPVCVEGELTGSTESLETQTEFFVLSGGQLTCGFLFGKSR